LYSRFGMSSWVNNLLSPSFLHSSCSWFPRFSFFFIFATTVPQMFPVFLPCFFFSTPLFLFLGVYLQFLTQRVGRFILPCLCRTRYALPPAPFSLSQPNCTPISLLTLPHLPLFFHSFRRFFGFSLPTFPFFSDSRFFPFCASGNGN